MSHHSPMTGRSSSDPTNDPSKTLTARAEPLGFSADATYEPDPQCRCGYRGPDVIDGVCGGCWEEAEPLWESALTDAERSDGADWLEGDAA